MLAAKSLVFCAFIAFALGADFESLIRQKREWFTCSGVPPQCDKGKTTCSWSDDCQKECIKASTASKAYVSGYCCTAGINSCYCCTAQPSGSGSGTASNSNARVSCTPPYQPTGTSFLSRCAWINDTSSAAVAYKDAEASCQKTGGRVMSLESAEKAAWFKAQKRSNAAWVSPKGKDGCQFIFTDNTIGYDDDCDGKRGFLKNDVKSYACEKFSS